MYDTDDVMHKLDDIELNMLTTRDLYQLDGILSHLVLIETHMLTTLDLLTYCD